MMWTDDPVKDYERYDAQRCAELERLPVCDECGNPIQDEEYYEFDGTLICEECLIDNHRKRVDDYLERVFDVE